MSGQVHSGTVFRALFAGGIAVWSKAAAIAKVRPRRLARSSQRGHRRMPRGPLHAAVAHSAPTPSLIAGRRRRRRESRGRRGRERRRVHRRHRGPREAPRAREAAVRRPRGSPSARARRHRRKDENENQARRSRRRPRADADGHPGGVLAAVLGVRGRADDPVLADPRRARRRPQRRRRRRRRVSLRRVPRGPASVDGRREGDDRGCPPGWRRNPG